MPATTPTAGDVHVNGPLSNFSQKYMNDESTFVSLDAMPNAPSQHQSDLYYEFPKGEWFRDNAQIRADGTESAGGGFPLSTTPYYANVYAWHKDVTDRQRANADNQVRLEQSASQFCAHKLMIRRERAFAAAFYGASIWTTDEGGTANWTNASTPTDPVTDIDVGKDTVQLLTGKRPNKMICTLATWTALKSNDEILSRITGGATGAAPAQVQKQLITQLFELDEIHVMGSVYNAAVEGIADAMTFIAAGDTALLYYAPDSVALDEPSAGVQFSWTGFTGATPSGQRVKRFRNEATESDRIECQMAFDYKVTAADLGYFFTDLGA